MRDDARAVFGGDRAVLGGDRKVVSGDLAVARGDGEVLCRASEILGGESDSGRVEGAKGRHPRGGIGAAGRFPNRTGRMFDDKCGGSHARVLAGSVGSGGTRARVWADVALWGVAEWLECSRLAGPLSASGAGWEQRRHPRDSAHEVAGVSQSFGRPSSRPDAAPAVDISEARRIVRITTSSGPATRKRPGPWHRGGMNSRRADTLLKQLGAFLARSPASRSTPTERTGR